MPTSGSRVGSSTGSRRERENNVSAAFAWFVTGLIFLAVELVMPHLVLLFFGIGAWGAALCAACDTTTQVQIIFFQQIIGY